MLLGLILSTLTLGAVYDIQLHENCDAVNCPQFACDGTFTSVFPPMLAVMCYLQQSNFLIFDGIRQPGTYLERLLDARDEFQAETDYRNQIAILFKYLFRGDNAPEFQLNEFSFLVRILDNSEWTNIYLSGTGLSGENAQVSVVKSPLTNLDAILNFEKLDMPNPNDFWLYPRIPAAISPSDVFQSWAHISGTTGWIFHEMMNWAPGNMDAVEAIEWQLKRMLLVDYHWNNARQGVKIPLQQRPNNDRYFNTGRRHADAVMLDFERVRQAVELLCLNAELDQFNLRLRILDPVGDEVYNALVQRNHQGLDEREVMLVRVAGRFHPVYRR